MKIKTSELTDKALDWAVAKAQRRTILRDPMEFKDRSYWIWEETPNSKGGIDLSKSVYMKIGTEYAPTTKWDQGGPIIDQHNISVGDPAHFDDFGSRQDYMACIGFPEDALCVYQHGPTPLIAVSRCFVASELGDEIDVPEELA